MTQVIIEEQNWHNQMHRDEIETIPTTGRTIKSVVWPFIYTKKKKKKANKQT